MMSRVIKLCRVPTALSLLIHVFSLRPVKHILSRQNISYSHWTQISLWTKSIKYSENVIYKLQTNNEISNEITKEIV